MILCSGKFFFSDGLVPEHIWKQLEAPFRKIWGQNIILRIRSKSEQKILWIRIRKKLVRIHNTACNDKISVHLYFSKLVQIKVTYFRIIMQKFYFFKLLQVEKEQILCMFLMNYIFCLFDQDLGITGTELNFPPHIAGMSWNVLKIKVRRGGGGDQVPFSENK
jgi:hypothetical protein